MKKPSPRVTERDVLYAALRYAVVICATILVLAEIVSHNRIFEFVEDLAAIAASLLELNAGRRAFNRVYTAHRTRLARARAHR